MESPAPEASVDSAAQGSGLLRSLRTLLATLLDTARARGELLQVEFEEEKLRVAGITMFAAAAAFFLALAVVVLTIFLILLFWDSHRVMVAGLIALAYVLIGLCCALIARQRARVKSKLFAASLAELRRDAQRLQP